jgi:hypothetical protein
MFRISGDVVQEVDQYKGNFVLEWYLSYTRNFDFVIYCFRKLIIIIIIIIKCLCLTHKSAFVAFLLNIYNGSKAFPTFFQTVGLQVPNRKLRVRILLNGDLKFRKCPASGCTSTVNTTSIDIVTFTAKPDLLYNVTLIMLIIGPIIWM